MGDDNGRPADGQRFERFLDNALALIVERGGRLVHNEDRRIFEEDASNADSLFLSAGEFDTALSDIGVKAGVELHNEFIRTGEPCGMNHFLKGCAGLPVLNIVEDGAGEQVHILFDDADILSQTFECKFPNILAVNGDGSARDIVKAGNQIANGGLSSTRRPHECDGLSLGCFKINLFQHHLVVIRIGKIHIVEADIPLHMTHRNGILPVENIGLGLHHFCKAFDSGHSALELFHELDDSAHGSQHGRDKHRVGEKIAGGDAAVHQENSAAHEDDEVHQAVKKSCGRLKCGHVSVCLLFDIEKMMVRAFEFVEFQFLICEGFDDLDSEKAVFDIGIEVADMVALFFECAAHSLIEPRREVDHQRNHRKENESQRNIDGEKDDEGDDKFQRTDKEFLRTVMRKFRDIKQIRCNAAHQLSDLCIAVVGMGKRIEMFEEIPAHIRLDHRTHHMTDIRHIVVRRHVDDLERGKHETQFDNHIDAEESDILQPCIYNKSEKHRQRDVADHRERCTEEVKSEDMTVLSEVRFEFFNQLICAVCSLVFGSLLSHDASDCLNIDCPDFHT